MKIWTCGSSSWSGPQNAWMGIKNINGASRLSNFWNIFSMIQMIFCHDWWPWTKPGYINMTRRQSNNQWSGGIAAHPTPKNSECKYPLEKFSPRFFWDQDGILLVYYLPKGQTINVEYYLSPLVQLKDIFKEKCCGKVTKGVFVSCKTTPQLTGHSQPRRNWPTWASDVLITQTILWIWPCRTTTCSLDWKNNWKVAFFIWHGGHCCRGELVGLTTFWIFFWVACKS